MFRCILLMIVLSPGAVSAARADALPGFSPSEHFAEQLRNDRFEDCVTIRINAPGDFDARRPTLLVLYALPNGNSIDETIGRQPAPGRHWRYAIQQIAAQIRYLRAQETTRNVVVAYLEAEGKSWPAWRTAREDSGARITRLIEQLRTMFAGEQTRVALTCHSGGGALLLDYIDHVEAIPPWVARIVFLDAHYSYDTERHAEKLRQWLRDPAHHLGVYAYDDRDVTYNGKPIVSKTGGTWRATQRMLTGLAPPGFTETETDTWLRATTGDGRVELIRLKNPERKILHTVMVERNGLIHGLTFEADNPDGAAAFCTPAVYGKWIQP